MKKKGFTLIELLAVIVILAIIALIATPTILGIIDKARLNAAEISAQNYADALEQKIFVEQINGDFSLEDGKYSIDYLNDNLDLNLAGDYPDEGSVIIEDKKIKSFNLSYKDIDVEKDAKTGEISSSKNKDTSYLAYEIGDVVEIADKEWIVINDSDDTNPKIKVILSTNIDDKTYPYDMKDTCMLGNVSGCQVIYSQATIKSEIVNYINSLNISGVDSNELEYSGLIRFDDLEILGCKIIENSGGNYDCTSAPTWLTNSNYWVNSLNGMYQSIVSSDATPYNDNTYGIRPVITINKENVSKK